MNKQAIIKQVVDAFAQRDQRLSVEVVQELALVRGRLKDAGIDLERIDDLKRDVTKWRQAIPTLQECLSIVQTPNVKDTLIRLLSVPFARGVEVSIIREFRASKDESIRWAAGNALEVLASDKIENDIVNIAMDRGFGWSRQMVVAALGKIRSERALKAAIASLDDEDVVLHALSALARMRDPEAIPFVEPFLRHKKAAIRKEARKTLERLGKAKTAQSRLAH